jgi:hypothetical protein
MIFKIVFDPPIAILLKNQEKLFSEIPKNKKYFWKK